MKTGEDRGRVNSGPRRRSERGKVSGSIGCLHVETTMGTAVVVARVLSEDALRVMSRRERERGRYSLGGSSRSPARRTHSPAVSAAA